MNVFDFAMKMEEDGKTYYLKMAGETSNQGLKTIFNLLAEDEQKHYDIFQELKSSGKVPDMQETTVLEASQNVFEKLPKSEKELEGISTDLDGYRHAMQLEVDSFRLYEEAAEKASEQTIKNLLLKVAAEERKHFNILDNIYQFVNAPNQHLAWREFSNLDEFHQFGRDVDK